MLNNCKNLLRLAVTLVFLSIGFYTIDIFAAEPPKNIGEIADILTGTFTSVGQLMAAAAYVAGFGLTIAAIFKFKQHKDNPQQIPMGTPITMLIVGVTLIFLPNIFTPAGQSIFGTDAAVSGFGGKGLTDTLPK